MNWTQLQQMTDDEANQWLFDNCPENAMADEPLEDKKQYIIAISNTRKLTIAEDLPECQYCGSTNMSIPATINLSEKSITNADDGYAYCHDCNDNEGHEGTDLSSPDTTTSSETVTLFDLFDTQIKDIAIIAAIISENEPLFQSIYDNIGEGYIAAMNSVYDIAKGFYIKHLHINNEEWELFLETVDCLCWEDYIIKWAKSILQTAINQ